MKTIETLLHTKTFEIFWDDMDAYGHVNNAKYFTYMQECRFDWLYSLKIPVSPNGKAPVLGATSCKFIRPIFFPATICVELYEGPRIDKKIKFIHKIKDKSNPEIIYAIGDAEVVWFDFVNNKSIFEPEEYRKIYQSSST